ncbi:MAG: transposase [Thermoplasmata archaeon]
MSYPNMTKTLKVGMNNDVYKFIDLTFMIAKRSMPEYSNKFSKKIYTQWQIFVLLAIKIYFNVSYRGLIAEVEYNPTIIDQLSLEYIPHYTTVQKFMERMKVRGLEKVFRKALLIIRERFENDMLGIDATGYSTEYHSHYYDKRVREFGMRRKIHKNNNNCSTWY